MIKTSKNIYRYIFLLVLIINPKKLLVNYLNLLSILILTNLK